MNYIRTSSGCMMAINTKSTTQIAVKKQKATTKPARKSKKGAVSALK